MTQLKLPKVSKFSTPTYCKHSNVQTKRFCHGVIPLDDVNRIVNREDRGLHCFSKPLRFAKHLVLFFSYTVKHYKSD